MVIEGTPQPDNTLPTPQVRIFICDNREYPDPNPDLSLVEVQKLLSDFMPELHNAEVKETDKDGKHYVNFIKKVGTKG